VAAEKTVYVKVGAKVDGAVAGLRKVQGSINDLTKSDLKKPQKAFDDLSNKAALVGGVVAFGIGKAVSSFADFDQAMSGVAANSGATGAELDSLRDKAMQLGADTQFSATEAAQGINELAKAGVSSQEILNGGLKGALDLAAAGQIGVAQAAETTASALNQFEQDGSQATHVADLLSNAANAAQGGVGDMGQALSQAGVAAHATGLDIDETTTLLALFAKAGMTGSDAGTALKTMLQRLIPQSDKAAAAMEEIGLKAYDLQGNFIGAEELVRQLSEGTKGLSEETKMAALNTIFGSDAIRAASIASAAGADGYKKMSTEVTKAGGAAANAAKLTDNLKGDIERLGGSIDTAFIQAGSSANSGLRTLTQGLGGVVDVVGNLPAPLILAASGFAALALTVPKGISVYRDFSKNLDTMGLSMDKINTKAPRLGASLRGLQGVAAGLTIAAIIGGISNSLTDLAEVKFDPQSIKDGAVTLDGFNKKMAETTDLGLPIATTISDFGQVLEATFNPGKGQQIDSFFAGINSNLGFENTSDVEVARKRFQEMDATLTALVTGGNGPAAKAMFDQITVAAKGQGITVDQLKSKLPGYAQAVVDTAGDVGRLNGAVDGTNESAGSADRALGDLADGGLKDVEAAAKDAKKEMQNLLDLVDSMAGGKRALASDKAGLKDAADAAIEAAKYRGGNDPKALKAVQDAKDELAKAQSSSSGSGSGRTARASADAIAKAQLSLKQAQAHLTLVQSNSKSSASALESARNRVESATMRLSQAQGKASASSGNGDATAKADRIKRAQDALAAANEQLAKSYVSPEKAQADYEESMRKTAETGDRLIHDLIDQKKPISDINAAYDAQRAALIKAANARGIHGKAAEDEADKVGITVQEMDDLRYQYAHTQEFVDTQVRTPGLPEAKKGMEGYWEVINGVPTFHETKVTTPGLPKAKDDINGYWTVINGVPTFKKTTFAADCGVALTNVELLKKELAGIPRNIETIVKVRSVQNELKLEANGINTNLATGGAVRGPGTGTSDSIPAMLSNGEHVLTAAEVAAAGGHGAIFALRKAILTGGVQFRAAGGPANASAYRAAPVYMGSSRGPSAAEIGAAVAAQMPPQVSVYSGHDARTAARTAIRDWEWGQTQ